MATIAGKHSTSKNIIQLEIKSIIFYRFHLSFNPMQANYEFISKQDFKQCGL